MSNHISLQVDPSDVLGVSKEATLQEIRDAYRTKVKRYHPDVGGEEWAFRILSQAYEILSTARIVRATHREFDETTRRPPYRAPKTPPPPPPPRPEPASPFAGRDMSADRAKVRARHDPNETIRPGVQESTADLSRLVNVEKLTIRYEAEHVWLITEHASDHRFLSCCLNVAWPDPSFPHPPSTIARADTILEALGKSLDVLGVQSQAVASRWGVDDGRFAGWLSYPSVDKATDAFVKLRDLLHRSDLAVKQWSRDLIIPRQWR